MPEAICFLLQTYSCHGNDVTRMRTKFMLIRGLQVRGVKKLSEAICCGLQTCFVVFFIVGTKYIVSHSY